ncbi:MAG: HlyD family efflux transporter periplasmic adaptor subunit [Bacteroidetes bacterium]|nr:MAG: HlyD family efflux transporter periplasmic adaptor subunit [Bacteroidota bacterium]
MKNICFLALIFFLFSCGKKSDSTFPVRKDITQAVYASGKIYPLNDYKVYAKLPGYVEKIHVHVGDSVKTGQPLLTIKSEVSEKNVEMAKNQYELAQKNAGDNSPVLSAVKEDVASARSKFELDSANYIRFTNLLKENATSGMQLDQAKTQFEISKQNFLKAFNNFISTRDRLKTELENVRLQYEAQTSNQSDYVIASVVNGKIYDIVPKEGELVSSMLMLMEVGDGTRFEVELSVDETDVSFLQKDQAIVYSIDAYKDKIFKGNISETYPRINQMNKTSKVIATIVFDKSVSVFSGMSVEANIIIATKNNALVVPREYLFNGKRVIRKSEGDTVEVQKGAEDLEFVEIVNGIDEKTEIIKP